MYFKYKGYRVTKKDEITDLGKGEFFAIDLSECIKYNPGYNLKS